MSVYFDKDEIILAMVEKGQSSKRYKLGETWELNFGEIREALATVHPADVRPVVRGEWEWEMYQYTPQCSVCGGDGRRGPAYETKFNFCPWCGADMREGNDRITQRIRENGKDCGPRAKKMG